MWLINLLATGTEIKTIAKSEIPALLGELETLKSRLWVRLTEWEGLDSVRVFARTAKEQARDAEKPAQSEPYHRTLEPEGRILRMKDVIRMAPLSRATIWNMVRDGNFPKQRHLGPRSEGWLDTEIQEWIKRRFDAP